MAHRTLLIRKSLRHGRGDTNKRRILSNLE